MAPMSSWSAVLDEESVSSVDDVSVLAEVESVEPVESLVEVDAVVVSADVVPDVDVEAVVADVADVPFVSSIDRPSSARVFSSAARKELVPELELLESVSEARLSLNAGVVDRVVDSPYSELLAVLLVRLLMLMVDSSWC
ncbi:hypothetical protein D7S86_21965 [Pararobbsia silviterrae]|uniref:Uncharacterized protein n=1 Tax=Pararobbsia silviterrae TaxID=1792498 RepID=A0A494XDT1_9BURK|nr:hypothetical protein D7S86_21965 [Pararobbsia silviterrae]